ncbi:nose resistant to fluoxetine protein 6 [Caerostris extrusa]|uniref:Nose resistant to fluoxetine protein 6 n=1 Tax=Caerostris extrusa TaxID=172846 RepID=A0AAV4YG07_CAEEX|nr:nose resistant to fluoxetine protein 6 [Caerostris extrusa]
MFLGLEKVRAYAKDFAFQAVINATVAVDTFFCIGGLLVCYLTIKLVKVNGHPFNIKLYIFHRLWRLHYNRNTFSELTLLLLELSLFSTQKNFPTYRFNLHGHKNCSSFRLLDFELSTVIQKPEAIAAKGAPGLSELM